MSKVRNQGEPETPDCSQQFPGQAMANASSYRNDEFPWPEPKISAAQHDRCPLKIELSSESSHKRIAHASRCRIPILLDSCRCLQGSSGRSMTRSNGSSADLLDQSFLSLATIDAGKCFQNVNRYLLFDEVNRTIDKCEMGAAGMIAAERQSVEIRFRCIDSRGN